MDWGEIVMIFKGNFEKVKRLLLAASMAVVMVSFTACTDEADDVSSLDHDVMISMDDGKVYEGGLEFNDVQVRDSISIPGYDTFEFVAGKKDQEIMLHNPKDNTCYFKMSLILDDGTVIWAPEELLEPGIAFSTIVLDKPLEEGTYENVTLKYQCYSLTDKSPYNGSEITVRIVASKEK